MFLSDLEYKKFLNERENPVKLDQVPIEQLIKEIDEKEKNAESKLLHVNKRKRSITELGQVST